jgi:ribulose-5-phosphate 4-epimerase/fuculose-1-phosphate aldolase
MSSIPGDRDHDHLETASLYALHALSPSEIAVLLLAGCGASSAPPAEADLAKKAASGFAEQTLVEELVLANRILASRETGVFDSYGQISVRSQTNPNHYYISRWVAPGLVTLSDIIENDLDSRAVGGQRNDQYPENILHGEIYKGRPEVMAVVHGHTPESFAFSQSSVPLGLVYNGATFIGTSLKNWVIGKYDPHESIVSTTALGQAMAKDMGNDTVMLLAGHGIALTAPSVYDLVSYANDLRINAQVQQQAILLGGRINFLQSVSRGGGGSTDRSVSAPDGSGGGRLAAERAWEYWRQVTNVN